MARGGEVVWDREVGARRPSLLISFVWNVGEMTTTDDTPFKCIFCLRSDRTFCSTEHVIPQSLGNDELVLPVGWVCDSCNQHFGTEIEAKALHSW